MILNRQSRFAEWTARVLLLKGTSTSDEYSGLSKWTLSLHSGKWFTCSLRRRKSTETSTTENVILLSWINKILTSDLYFFLQKQKLSLQEMTQLFLFCFPCGSWVSKIIISKTAPCSWNLIITYIWLIIDNSCCSFLDRIFRCIKTRFPGFPQILSLRGHSRLHRSWNSSRHSSMVNFSILQQSTIDCINFF